VRGSSVQAGADNRRRCHVGPERAVGDGRGARSDSDDVGAVDSLGHRVEGVL